MTDEDQTLVAMAALHGAKFIRVNSSGDRMWAYAGYDGVREWFTIARAAADYLYQHDLLSKAQFGAYLSRREPVRAEEVDPQFVASVLA
jgi:hypothetical protein